MSKKLRKVRIELGRRWLGGPDVLQLGDDSVVELDRASDDTVDVYVDGQLYARGEAVVVDRKLGVRVLEIVADETEKVSAGSR